MSHFGFASRNDEIPKSVVQVKKRLPEQKFRELGIDQVLKKVNIISIIFKQRGKVILIKICLPNIFGNAVCWSENDKTGFAERLRIR
jgi:hypothetical protein